MVSGAFAKENRLDTISRGTWKSERLCEDRMWGVYAVSYDALLRGFKPL